MEKHYRREIVHTEDGSTSLFLPDLQEHYHSIHGAVQESMHVFIHQGFEMIPEGLNRVSILEVGLGTGLNCLLTAIEAQKRLMHVSYTALEPFPLDGNECRQLNFPEVLGDALRNGALRGEALRGEALSDEALSGGALRNQGLRTLFMKIHEAGFEHETILMPEFSFLKTRQRVQDMPLPDASIDLIYYDAFGPQVEPEMWTSAIFRNMFDCLSDHGMLVTYCARGSVKRMLKECGFVLEHPPGPPGKREMTRARKGC